MLRTYFLLALILFISTISFSQEKKIEDKAETVTEIEKFKPNGRALVKIFANYHTNFAEISKMQIERAYLGYNYNFSENYSAKITLDVTGTDFYGKLRYDVFLKIAQLQYKKNKTTIKVGLIPTTQFKVQEKFWGYRYIMKSFQDIYRMNGSADLGVSVDYKIFDNFSVDVIVQNGEGYKSIEPTGTYRGGLGLTYLPIKSLIIRVYSDISSMPDVNRVNFAAFIGYKFKKLFKVGAEYNLQIGNRFVQEKEYSGVSAYTTVFISKKFNVFARYDLVKSNTLENDIEPWYIKRNGNGLIAGIEYSPIKGVKVSTNYRGWQSDIASKDFESMFYLNFQYSFK